MTTVFKVGTSNNGVIIPDMFVSDKGKRLGSQGKSILIWPRPMVKEKFSLGLASEFDDLCHIPWRRSLELCFIEETVGAVDKSRQVAQATAYFLY